MTNNRLEDVQHSETDNLKAHDQMKSQQEIDAEQYFRNSASKHEPERKRKRIDVLGRVVTCFGSPLWR